MREQTIHERLTVIATDVRDHHAEFAEAVRSGLTASPKSLPWAYLYDEQGSQFFEEICAQPEYYLTRTERRILEQHANDMVGCLRDGVTFVELGCGNASKTRLLLEALLRRDGEGHFVPVDISRAMLEETSETLLHEYPALKITAFAAEYEKALDRLESEFTRPKVLLFLGSNLGNFTPAEAVGFLRRIRDCCTPEDRLLLGLDLQKSAAILEPAYNDAAGVTARFSLNLLERINRELGGDFDTDHFLHRAQYSHERGRVDIWIESTRQQTVAVDQLELSISFRAGEPIHTEESYKYSLDRIEQLTHDARWRIERQWFDENRWFSVNLLAPTNP